MRPLRYTNIGLPLYSSIELNAERWPNFKPSELACFEGSGVSRKPCRYCGGEYYHWPEFLDRLQALRDNIGKPLIITSAHRCVSAELRVGGTMNQHLRLAVDIGLRGHDRHEILNAAKKAGFKGMGFYNTFMHLDLGRKRVWYGRGARKAWGV